jgi:hypothetical protein
MLQERSENNCNSGFALSALSICSIALSAKVPMDVTDGDKECSANHYHVNDLVSYAEMREQRFGTCVDELH